MAKAQTKSHQQVSGFRPTDVSPRLTAEPIAFVFWAEVNHHMIVREFYSLKESASTAIPGTLSDEALLESLAFVTQNQLEIKQIPFAWKKLAEVDAKIQIHSTCDRVLTALSLESHSHMWTWFDTHVTQPTKHLASLPVSSAAYGAATMPNGWIFKLFLDVSLASRIGIGLELKAKKYIEGLIDAPDYETGSFGQGAILRHVEAAVISWLHVHAWPGTCISTSRGIAKFISIARGAFGSPNFLYLNHVQTALWKLRSVLTEEKVALPEVPWEILALGLKDHPLANPQSRETISLQFLMELLWVVSGLPPPKLSTISAQYKQAIEVGGDAGIQIFAQLVAEKLPQ